MAKPTKNFNAPDYVPDYFTNEAGAAVNRGAPNQDVDTDTYTPPANTQEYRKQLSEGTAFKDKTELNDAVQAAERAIGPKESEALLKRLRGGREAQPQQAREAQPVPSAGDPKTRDWADMLRRLKGDDGHAGTVDRYGVPPAEGSLDGVGHFFRTVPQSVARGFADSLGFPADSANWLFNYYAHNPSASFIEGFPSGADIPPGLPEDQNLAPFAAAGSQSVRKLAGRIGINTNLPSEEGDYSNAAKWAEALGYAAGAAGPFTPLGVANAARQATGAMPFVMGAAKSVAKDIGLALFGGGLGRELAENVTGGPQAEKAAEAVGQVAGPAVAMKAGGAVSAAVAGAKILATSGLIAAERSGNPLVQQLIKGQFNASELARQVADNPDLAGRMAARHGGVQGPGRELPEGFNVPAATASMDLPSQALMHQVVIKDNWANAEYRKVLANNENILERMLPGQGEAGMEDVSTFLQGLTQNRVEAKQRLISQAVDQADHDLGVATKGASFNPEETGQLRRAYDENLRNQLLSAWAESNATTRAEFDAARAAGLDKATIPTTRMYDRFADMMSESVKKGMEDHFPSKVLAPLYDKPPLKMFDPEGKPIGNLPDNYMLGSTAPWERMQGLYNNIDNELHATMRKGGDPVKLQYLMRMQDEVLTTMKDMRMAGGRFAPGTLPASLQNAINSAQENRRLFVDSPVGKVLGFDRPGAFNMPNDAKSIRAWLANTPETSQRVQSLFDAVAGKSVVGGVHPADALRQNIDSLLRQEFADAYRTGGNTAAGRWLNNNDALLNHPQFTQLRDEFRSSLNSRDVAERMTAQGTSDVDEIRKSRAMMFLNSDPEKAIGEALRGNNKYTATREIIQDLREDPTGRALQGFANMAFDRMAASASNYAILNQPGTKFSGAAAEKYYTENRGMFQALDREIPGFDGRVKQWVEGAKMMDKIQAKPEGIPLSQKEIAFSLTGFGGIMARIMGAELGRKMGTGTIQVPGITANLADKFWKQFTNTLPADRAQALLSRAMIEPDVFAQLMRPITAPQQMEHLSQLLQPYLLSAPSVIYNTSQQHSNPQKPME